MPGAELPLRYGLEVDYGEHGAFPVRRPLPPRADARRARPAPAGRGPPRAALRAPRRARARRSTASPARPSRCGRRTRARSASSATSTAGTGACTRCARSAPRASGSCSCPASRSGDRYKFEIRAAGGELVLHADPFAFAADVPPETTSIVHEPAHEWRDAEWLTRRRASCDQLAVPMSIYEVHLGSWRRRPEEGDRMLTYRRARRRAGRLRGRHGLHPRRAAARDGAPVHRLVGLPGHLVLRPHPAVRHARRLPRVRRPHARRAASACCSTGCRRTSRATTGRWRASTAPRSTSTPTRAAARTRTGAR